MAEKKSMKIMQRCIVGAVIGVGSMLLLLALFSLLIVKGVIKEELMKEFNRLAVLASSYITCSCSRSKGESDTAMVAYSAGSFLLTLILLGCGMSGKISITSILTIAALVCLGTLTSVIPRGKRRKHKVLSKSGHKAKRERRVKTR